jgi:uncharacterized protein YecT (DUF1311 family)
MLKLALLPVLALLLATAPPHPPVITEIFTPLPCPAKPVSTLDIEGCLERRILASDAAINKRVRFIFLLLKSGGSARAVGHFVRGERAWLAYRRAVCTSRSDIYEGGTAAPLAYAHCAIDLNATHLKELMAFEHELRR